MVSTKPAPEMMETREASPAHLLIKIESFSSLDSCGIEKYETNEFIAGDYKWRLIIYPNGDEIGKDSDHISVHLAMGDMTSMSENWEVNAVFRIFLFNQICDNYWSLGMTKRFHSMKPEWGFPEFISKDSFSDPSNGYLVDDSCVFGAEVFVIKSQAVTECLTLKNLNIPYKRNWTIPNFSKLKDEWYSEIFIAGDQQWKVKVYPKGYAASTGQDVSIYLEYASSERVHANVTICIKNQLDDSKHNMDSYNHWFSDTEYGRSWGWASFIELATINDPKKGFIVNDSCLLNIEISVQAVVRGSSPSS